MAYKGKPKTNKKASQRDKPQQNSTQEKEWQDLRAAVAKDLGQDLAPKSSKYFLPTELSFLDVNLGWKPGSRASGRRYGLASGRITLIHGDEAALKTRLLYHLGALAQQAGGFFWLDNPENSWHDEAAAVHGVDTSEHCFMYTQSRNIEEYLNTATKFMQSPLLSRGVPIFAGLDTLAALSTKGEASNTMDHTGLPMGVPGKLAQWFRSTNELKCLGDYPFYMAIVQQNRDQAGGGGPFGHTGTKVPGGRALRFWVSTQIEVNTISGDEAERYGLHHLLADGGSDYVKIHQFHFRKNRSQISGRKCAIPYWLQWGWHDPIACFEYLLKNSYASMAGAYVNFNGANKFRDDWHKLLETDPKFAKTVVAMGQQAYYQDHFEDKVTIKAHKHQQEVVEAEDE